MIEIGRHGSIPESELNFDYARSGGPGGQHVNKVNTKVILLFDVQESQSLTGWQKNRILEKLATRINREGILRVSSEKHRSQSMNRDAAVARFAELLDAALTLPKRRRKTRVSRSQKQKRLDTKKKRGQLKKDRRSTE
jgi:ribosome-associated protein